VSWFGSVTAATQLQNRGADRVPKGLPGWGGGRSGEKNVRFVGLSNATQLQNRER